MSKNLDQKCRELTRHLDLASAREQGTLGHLFSIRMATHLLLELSLRAEMLQDEKRQLTVECHRLKQELSCTSRQSISLGTPASF